MVNTKKISKKDQEILDFINEMGYDWTLQEIKAEYVKMKDGWYISYSAKKIINNCLKSFE